MLHGILLMRKTERIQRLAEEQRILMEAKAQADTERKRAAEQRAKRIGIGFSALAFLVGFPSLVLGFLQVIGESDPKVAGAALLVSMLIGGLLMFVVHLWLREPGRSKDDGSVH